MFIDLSSRKELMKKEGEENLQIWSCNQHKIKNAKKSCQRGK